MSGRRRWRVAGLVAFTLAGLLFVTSASAAKGSDLRSGRATRLADLIRVRQQGNERLSARVEALRAEVAKTSGQRSALGGQPSSQAEVATYEAPAGLRPVRGPAVAVSLDDAPEGALTRSYPGLPKPAPDDLVVHQQDVQAVVNALWAGGAEAMGLMDQRVVSTSAVRCVGNTLILQGRVYSPPYVVTAIGDPAALRAALAESPAVGTYRDYVAAYGLGYDLRSSPSLRLPAFDGSLRLRYAAAVQ